MTDLTSGNGHRDLLLPPRGTGRRRSLLTLGFLLLGLPAAFLLRLALDQGWREVTSVQILETRDVIYLPQIKVFLVDGEPPLALSALSPHLGDRIAYCADGDLFAAVGHGERFERNGGYRSGPGGQDMTRIAIRVREGIVEINLRRVTTDPTRPQTASEDVAGTGVCNFTDWSELRPGFLEPDPA